MNTTEKATCAQEQLRSIEHPPSTSNTHPKQVIGLGSVYTLSLATACAVKHRHIVVLRELFAGTAFCILLEDEVIVREVDERHLGQLPYLPVCFCTG